MVVTVLLTIAASTIVWIITRQAADSVVSSDRDTSLNNSENLIGNALDRVEAELVSAPDIFLDRVLIDEADRVCTTGPAKGTAFSGGSVWPSSCGTYWVYSVPQGDWEGYRVEINPPNASNPNLVVVGRARAATGAAYSTTRHYTRGGAGTFSVVVANDSDNISWDMSQTVFPSQSVTVEGVLYARNIENSTVEGSLAGPDVLAAETLADSTGPGATRLFSAEGGDLESVRRLTSTPISEASTAQAHAIVKDLACNGNSHENVTGNRSSNLCLQPGGAFRTSGGDDYVIPGTAESFAVVPEGDLLHIYTTDTFVNTDANTATSPLLCNGTTSSLVSCAGSISGDFPGDASDWDFLGSVFTPYSGALYAEGQLVVGMCGRYLVDTPCAEQSETGTPGVVFSVPVSMAAPQVIIGAPITADVSVAIASASEIVLPYWARPHGEEMNVDAHIFAAGADASQGIRAFPDDLSFTGVDDTNWAEGVTFTGSVVAVNSNGKLGLEGFKDVTYRQGDVGTNTPLWVFPAGRSWQRVSSADGYLNRYAFDWQRLGVEYHVVDTAALSSVSLTALGDLGGGAFTDTVPFTSDSGATVLLDEAYRGIPSVQVGGGVLTSEVSSTVDLASSGFSVAAHLSITSCDDGQAFTGFSDILTVSCDTVDGGAVVSFAGEEVVVPGDAYGLALVGTYVNNVFSVHVASEDRYTPGTADPYLLAEVPVAVPADAEIVETFIGAVTGDDIFLHEVAFVTRAMSAREAATAIDYLNYKWGTAGNNGGFGVAQLTISYDPLVFNGTGRVYAPTVTGGSGNYEFSYTGELPPQVTFDTATGEFTGPVGWDSVATDIAGNWATACALMNTGHMWCWGQGGNGEINTNGGAYNSPTQPTWPGGSTYTHLGDGQKVTCAARGASSIGYCWGELSHTTEDMRKNTGYSVQEIDAGTSMGCLLHTNGWVYCFGQRGLGQVVGAGSPWSDEPMRQATALGQNTIAELSAGPKHYCARRHDGRVLCWGQVNTSYSGQVGNMSGGSAGSPRWVLNQDGSQLDDVDEMDSGFSGSCAIVDGRTRVKCWGFGQDYATYVPQFGNPGDVLTNISVGSAGSICLLNNTVPNCWGTGSTSKTSGILGNGSATGTDILNPAELIIPDNTERGGFQDVQMGQVGCIIDQGGSVACWGTDNSTGDGNYLGTGSMRTVIPFEEYTLLGNPGFPSALTVTVIDLGATALPGSTGADISAEGLPS